LTGKAQQIDVPASPYSYMYASTGPRNKEIQTYSDEFYGHFSAVCTPGQLLFSFKILLSS
jgi:hypothetical protein